VTQVLKRISTIFCRTKIHRWHNFETNSKLRIHEFTDWLVFNGDRWRHGDAECDR